MSALRWTLSLLVVVLVMAWIAACGLVIDPDLLVAGTIVPDGGPIDGAACDASSRCEPAPDGWSPVLLADSGRPDCPSGAPEGRDIRVVRGDGAVACACDCGASCDATATLTVSDDPACSSAPVTDAFSSSTTKCVSKSFDLPSGYARFTAASRACTPSDRATKEDATDGRTCAPAEAGGCGCVPETPGFETCIAKPGSNACPSSTFTKQRRAGKRLDDRRTCAGCTCDAKPCTAVVQLWTRPSCQGDSDVTIGGACAKTEYLGRVRAYRSTATGGCSPKTASTPEGALVFDGELTICCR